MYNFDLFDSPFCSYIIGCVTICATGPRDTQAVRSAKEAVLVPLSTMMWQCVYAGGPAGREDRYSFCDECAPKVRAFTRDDCSDASRLYAQQCSAVCRWEAPRTQTHLNFGDAELPESTRLWYGYLDLCEPL